MEDVLVLCYHAISDCWPTTMSVTPVCFERQLATLVRRGFVGTTFHQAVTDPPADRTLAVTFDDAFDSVLEHAYPILDRLGLPATVFVPTDFPDTPERPMAWRGIDQWLGGEFQGELKPLSWSQLGELADRGWEVGSHTRSHPHLPSLDDATLDAELAGSREVCEQRLGRPCMTVAYPYGEYDARVVEAADRAGYEAAATLPRRLARRGPLESPRVGVYRRDSDRRFALKASRSMRRLRGSRLWPAR